MVFWDQIVIQILSILILISNIIIILFFLDFLYYKTTKRFFLKSLWNYSGKRAILFIFIISFSAMIGSLIFSEVLNFEPCILCWYQRILMYPIAFLSGLALLMKDRGIIPYILFLSILGFPLAAYQYLGQINSEVSLPCAVLGSSISCSDTFFTTFGYITIPFMAVSTFALIIIICLNSKYFNKEI